MEWRPAASSCARNAALLSMSVTGRREVCTSPVAERVALALTGVLLSTLIIAARNRPASPRHCWRWPRLLTAGDPDPVDTMTGQ